MRLVFFITSILSTCCNKDRLSTSCNKDRLFIPFPIRALPITTKKLMSYISRGHVFRWNSLVVGSLKPWQLIRKIIS